MAQRDPKLSTNWQKLYRESGEIYVQNRSTLQDPQKDSEEAFLFVYVAGHGFADQ